MAGRDCIARRVAFLWPSVGRELDRTMQLYRRFNEHVLLSRVFAHVRQKLIALRNHANYVRCDRRLRATGKCLLSATGVAFWERDGITKKELQQTIDEFWRAYRSSGGSNGNRMPTDNSSDSSDAVNEDSADSDDESDEKAENGWEPIIIKEHFQVWRKPVPGTYLYRYKSECRTCQQHRRRFIDIVFHIFFHIVFLSPSFRLVRRRTRPSVFPGADGH